MADFETPLFTPDEFEPDNVTGVGNYPTLKKLTALVDRRDITPGKVLFNQHLHETWLNTVADNNRADLQAIQQASPNMVNADDVITNMQARTLLASKTATDNFNEITFKLREVAKSAAENITYGNINTLFNNDPATLDDKVAKLGDSAAASASIERDLEYTTPNSLWDWTKEAVAILSPAVALRNIAFMEVAVEAGLPKDAISYWTGNGNIEIMLRQHYKLLPKNKKQEWLDNLWLSLKSKTTIGTVSAKQMIYTIIGDEEPERTPWSDKFDQADPVLVLASGLYAMRQGYKLWKAGDKILDVNKILAQGGAKDALALQEVQNGLKLQTRKLRLKAAGTIAGEATGAAVVVDLAKFAAMGIHKVIPTSIRTSSAEVQAALTSETMKLIDDIKAIPRTHAFTEDELGEAAHNLMLHFNKAVDARIKHIENPSVTVDGREVLINATYGPRLAPRFATKEAAETALKNLQKEDPDSVYKVMPDTVNNSFTVSTEKVAELELKLKALYAKLTEFSSTVNKGGLTINGLTVQNVGKMGLTAAPKRASQYSVNAEQAIIREAAEAFDDVDNAKKFGFVTNNNITASRFNGNEDLLEFNNRIAPLIGMDGRKIFVTTLDALYQANDRKLHTLAAIAKNNYGSWNGIHFPVVRANGEEQSIIIMRYQPGDRYFPREVYQKAGKEYEWMRQHQIETFAHEYFHAFYNQYATKYKFQLESIFTDWLIKKGVTARRINGVAEGLTPNLPFEALLEYRNVTTASEMMHWANKYVNGDIKTLRRESAGLNKWLADFEEFHAEMFAKWAFADDIPKTALGNYFAEVIATLKNLADKVQQYLFDKGYIVKMDSANAFKRLMDRHIKWVQKQSENAAAALKTNNPKPVAIIDEANPRASKTVTLSTDELPDSITEIAANIKHIEDELEAAKMSSEGIYTGWVIERTKSVAAKLSDLKGYDAEEINDIARFGFGDRRLENTDSLYKSALLGVRTQSRITKLLTDFMRPSVEKLNNKEIKRLNEALIVGDKWGKELDVDELAGLGLSSKARIAYSKFHVVRKISLEIMRDQANASLMRRGFTQINLKTPVGDVKHIIGKETQVNLTDTVYDLETNTFVRVDAVMQESIKNKTALVYKPASDEMEINGNLVDAVFVRRNNVEIGRVTDGFSERFGEFSRRYSDEYFVDVISNANVNNRAKQITQTHRTAATKKDAEKYIEAMNAAAKLHAQGLLNRQSASQLMEGFGWNPDELVEAFAKEVFGANPEFKARYTRTTDDYIKETMKLNSGVNRKRGEKLLSVYGEDVENTLNPLDSLAAEIGNTAQVASFQEWRETQIVRWYESFKDALPDSLKNTTPIEAFIQLELYPALGSNNLKAAAAMKAHRYIKDMLEVPTREEIIGQGIARRLGELIEGEGSFKPMHKIGAFVRSNSDYSKYARTMSFVASFGLNPKHLFLQSMNAFNAIAVSPLYGLRSSKRMFFYMLALPTDNQNIIRRIGQIDKLSNLGFTETADFVNAVHDLKRSGLLDGINTDNLYSVKTGAYGFFNRKRRLAGKLMASPFNAGEGISRIISFDIARSEWLAANPGRMIDDKAMADILLRQDDLTQNMSRANRRAIQRGTISLATQFTGYFINMWTRVVNSIGGGTKKAFTRRETAQLLVIHGLAMGTAGTMLKPFEEIVGEYFSDSDIAEDAKIAWSQGLLAGLISHMSDGQLKLALGTTFGTFNYYGDLIDGLLNPEKTIWEVLSGPSGSIVLRTMKGIGDAYNIIRGNEITLDNIAIAGRTIASNTFTAFSNFEKALMFKNLHNTVYSKAGKPLYDVSEYEVMAKALGFQLVQDEDLSVAYATTSFRNNLIKKTAKKISELRKLSIAAINANKLDEFETYNNTIGFLIQSLDLSPDELNQLLNAAAPKQEIPMLRKLLEDIALRQLSPKGIVVNPER